MQAEHIEICLISEDAILIAFLEDFLKPLHLKIYRHWTQLPRRFARLSVPVIVIDDGLGTDHLEWPRHVKNLHPHSPVVFLTSRYLLQARLEALQQGADLCLTKPFAPEELALYLHKLLQRSGQAFALKSEQIQCGPFLLDIQAQQVYYHSKDLELTPLIFKLFWLFLSYPNTLMSRERIAEVLWGTGKNSRTLRTVDQYIRQLRKALEACNGVPLELKTYHRKGYALKVPANLIISEVS